MLNLILIDTYLRIYSQMLFGVFFFRCVTKLFLTCCKESKSPIVLESVVLPCLNILQMLIKPSPPKSKKNKVSIQYFSIRDGRYLIIP